jgi:NADPH-dependent ferric siderophore reductase
MTPDRLLDLVGRPGGPLADASLWHLEVTEAGPLTPNLYRLVLTAPGLGDLRFKPGQDLMLRVPQAGEHAVNRRYTIRQLDTTTLFEVDSPADEQELATNQIGALDLRWLHRLGRSAPGDTSVLLEAVANVNLPAGRGQVYVAAESRVVRAVQQALIERGLDRDQVSAKAYWRRGLPNTEVGEPTSES